MCSSAKSHLEVSYSYGSLSASEMNSYSLPTATSPRPADDAEVLSQRIPEQGATVLETPHGEIPDTGTMGGKTPMDSADGGRNKSGP